MTQTISVGAEIFKTRQIMKKIIMMAAILPVLFTACEKEATVNTLTATATVAGSSETKTTYTDNGKDEQSALRVSWNDSETFKAYYTNTEYVTFSKTSGNTFTATEVPAGVTASTEFTGVYGEMATYNSDGTVNIDFSGQDGTLENLGKYDVMTCVSTNEAGALKFAFQHKCAILRIKLTNYTAAAKGNVKITFKNFSAIGGNDINVPVTPGSGIIESTSSTVTFSMDVTAFSGNKSTGVSKTFYAAIPDLEWNGTSSGYEEYTGEEYFGKTVFMKGAILAGKIYDVKATCGVQEVSGGYWDR